MKRLIIIKATDGQMRLSEIEVADGEELSTVLTQRETGRTAVLRDFAAQFDGASIPVYEEQGGLRD
jgi:hypothetical protein